MVGCGLEGPAVELDGLGLDLEDGFHDEVEVVAPAHEGQGVDVFVALGEVQAPAQRS